MAHTLDRELQQYIPMLNISQKKSILEIVKSYLKPIEKEERISLEQYNIEINEALESFKAGNYFTQEEIEKEAETW